MTQPALKPVPIAPSRSPVTAIETFRLRSVLTRAVSAVGDRLMRGEEGSWEFDSPDKSHVTSRYDLEALGFIIRYVPEFLAKEKLPFVVSFENEELPLLPSTTGGERLLRVVIDPVDGSKAFDNYKCASDVPIPPPSSAVSVALVDPVGHELAATAVYCFDRGETFSSCLLNPGAGEPAAYIAYRNETLLARISDLPHMPKISAKRRVLNGNYNSRALVKLAEVELALMNDGLNPTFGGLAGSSATDIINVARGSFAACLDMRARCGGKGSVPYWYDIAGAIGVARGRGLDVLVTGADGAPLEGGDHEIYTPVSFIVARPDVFETVRNVVNGQFALALPVAA